MITRKDIKRLAVLSKLNIAEDEEQSYVDYIQNQLSDVKEIERFLSCDNIESDLPLNVGEYREDSLDESLAQSCVLDLATESKDGFVSLGKKA